MVEQSKFYRDQMGNTFWYLPSKGKDYLHRLDGPSIEEIDGTKSWYVDNIRHRTDGPAVEWNNESRYWIIDGKILNSNNVETWIKQNKVDLKTEEDQLAFKLRWS